MLAQASIGAILIALSIWAYFRNRLPKARVWMVVAGIFLFGFTGPVLHFIARGLVFVFGLLGIASGKWLGISAVTLFAISVILMIAEVVMHGFHPKGSAKKSTYWIAAALSILIVAGATPFAGLNSLPSSVQTGISQSQG